MPRLTEEERREVIRCIEADRPVPDQYRFRLFDSRREVELVWDGKTDAVCDAVEPFRCIERIVASSRRLDGWSNKLIWGDNRRILASLKHGPLRDAIEAQGGIKLIYIDPPFDVGGDFSMNIEIGDEAFARKPAALEKFAYRDSWGQGGESFLAMIYERLLLMRDLLADDGSIYVHCDWRVNSHIRLILDEIFGPANQRNQIRWCYRGGGVPKNDFAPKHDTIFRYSKSDHYTFNVDAVRIPYSDDVLRSDPSRYDKSYRGDTVYEGYMPNKKGKHPEDWWTIQPLMPSDKTERVGYPTQKPVELIQRIVDASTNPGDLVADFFCGSGTTLAVAQGLRVRRNKLSNGKEKLEYYCVAPRRWIGSDLSQLAIHVVQKRMIGIQRQLRTENRECDAFEVLHIGDAHTIDSEVANEPDSAANTAVPAESARFRPAERFISNLEINNSPQNAASIDVRTHVRNDHLAVELVGFSIASPQDAIAGNGATLKNKTGELMIEQGQIVKLSKAKDGTVVHTQITRHWPDWIDYWAVDFDFDGAIFQNAWQSFRTKKHRSLELTSDFHECTAQQAIAVKVVDIFGNETMKVVEVGKETEETADERG